MVIGPPFKESVMSLGKGMDALMEDVGIKHDSAKRKWKLLPWEQIEEVVKVLEFGAVKYGEENWKKLECLRGRCEQAAMRHLIAYMKNEDKDPETGLSHMAHLTCNALFLLWNEMENEKANKD